ncbi:MAG: hypothetical protein IJQ23_00275 [Clostridia bacterium]|nr:hypothetical protein [Clostridia bacterium]
MIEQLLKYQEVDAGLRKIEIELAGSEARKKAVSAKKYLESVDETVNKLDVKAAELAHIYEKMQEESKILSEQREEFVGALETATDENALNYLAKKADELYNKVKNLSQEATRVADAMQAVYKEYAGIRANIKTAQAQYTENVNIYGELKAARQDERSRIEGELKELEKNVDAKLMERYKAKRAAKIFPIIYEVKGNVCGACNMELPKSVLSGLKNGDVIECDQCGRLLFMKK